jgi:dTDP-4-dehydrorhamnose 3,5-epimerase
MKALVIPEGCPHGFQTLEDDVEMIYLHTAFYARQSEGAIRYDEQKTRIQWPLNTGMVSEKDMSYPFLPENFEGIDL